MKGNANMSFSTYPPNADADATAASIAEAFRNTPHPKNPLPTSILPAFPVGYIICKDVLIKVSKMDLATTEEKRHIMEKSQASGGFLCFSYNKSDENSKDTSRAAFDTASDGMLVRIPGPQILGYIQQIVPKDNSTPYNPKQSLGKEFYLPPVLSPDLSKNQNDSTSKTNGIPSGAAHGFRGKEELRDPKYAGHKFGVAHTSMSTTPDTKTDSETVGGSKGHTSSDDPSETSGPVPPPGSNSRRSHMANESLTSPLGDSKLKSVDELTSKIQQKLALDDGSLRAAIEKALGL